ncbi:MAG TPA: glycoside hydrolase family 3 N-terminal domain-containing protein [Gaiellaceae bacterium]
MHFWASLQVLLLALTMSPEQKARVMVVTTEHPGVFYGAAGIRFADQEGGAVKAFPAAPPALAARDFRTRRQAFAAGAATRRALRREGVDVDLAPVLDAPDGPLGSRQFRRGSLGVAFAGGLGDAACVKHFPGLGTAAYSTDERPHVDAHVRPRDLAPFRAVVRAGVPCVMVGHAFYGTRFRASLEPSTYRRLRATGFDGVAITDSLSIVHDAPVERWARQAARAGADMLLFTSPAHAERAVQALLPLAGRGELDAHVLRVLRLRARLHGN